MSNTFVVVEENPNSRTGPGGCLCAEAGLKITKGPYACFTTTEMDSVLSPTPVICAGCIRELNRDLDEFEARSSPEI